LEEEYAIDQTVEKKLERNDCEDYKRIFGYGNPPPSSNSRQEISN